MKKQDARKLDHKGLAQLRQRAINAVQNGESPEIVARVLGISRAAIYNWLAKYRQGGLRQVDARIVDEPHRSQQRFLLRSCGSNTPSLATIKPIESFVDTPLLGVNPTFAPFGAIWVKLINNSERYNTKPKINYNAKLRKWQRLHLSFSAKIL